MLNQWIRVFYSDAGVLTDYSLAAQNGDNIPFALETADYLYVAQLYPFNNIFFDVSVVNSNSANLGIEYWYGKQWVNGVDIIDATKLSGAPLARNGVLQFSPDSDYRWQQIVDTSKETGSGLTSLKIYDLYWMRIKTSANLSAGCVLKNLGYCFATGYMLTAIDPEINNYLTSWSAGKTSWDEQLVLASQYVVWDLKAKGLIIGPGNIIRLEDVSMATAHRCLMDIYAQLGTSFEGKFRNSERIYNELLSIKRFNFDTNDDGFLNRNEISNTVGKLVR